MADSKTKPNEELTEALMADVKKQAEEIAAGIIANAEKKATEIMESAKKEDTSGPKTAGPSEKEIKTAHEKVPVHLFKDNNLYRDDVYVAVNGQNIKIKRGQQVNIDKMFVEVLDNSRAQDAAAADLSESLESDYRKKSDALE